MRLSTALVVAFALAAAAPAVAATPNLSKLVLKPSQVGLGYTLQQRSDGRGTAQRTLDLCGTSRYPSEALRTARLQVNYIRANTPLAISNEVVTYKAGGAAQALREVARHASTCPRRPIAVEGAPPLTYRITRINDSKLLEGAVAVQIHIVGIIKGKPINVTTYAVYQRLGNVLSGVYSYGVTSPAQKQLCLHAAEASARNLRAAAKSRGVPA